MRLYLNQIGVLLAAFGTLACSAKEFAGDDSVEQQEPSENKSGDAPKETPPAVSNPAQKSGGFSLEPLSFKKFSLPITSDAFEISGSEGSVKIAKSIFEQSVTFFSIERSRHLSDYYWRLNARKFKFNENGFVGTSNFSSPVNLFPECNDPITGNGVSSFEVTHISDKFRNIGYSEDLLPDNVTHVRISVNCRSTALGESVVTKSKTISLATLAEDNAVTLSPLVDKSGIKCIWQSKKILVAPDGQLLNFRFWSGPKIPGNFTSVGSLALGPISECFEDGALLHIKASGACYSFDLKSNVLLSASCKPIVYRSTGQPFESAHSAYQEVRGSVSSPVQIYNYRTGSDIHIVKAELARISSASSPTSCGFDLKLNYRKNDAVESSAELKESGVGRCDAGSVSAIVGRESVYGQRLIGWSSDRRSLFLSSRIISDSAITSVRALQEEIGPEPVKPFSISQPMLKDSATIFPKWTISLISPASRVLRSQYKIFEAGLESSVPWQDWVDDLSYSIPSLVGSHSFMIKFRDADGFVSPEFSLANYAPSLWSQEAYLKASNAGADDYFGFSVSLSGDTLAVGASGEDASQNVITNGSAASSDNTAADSGAVYVFRRNGAVWAQEAYIKAPNAGISDSFGRSVSLSGDTLAVGAYGEDSSQNTVTNGAGSSSDNGALDTGAVYIFRRTGSVWSGEAYLKAANANAADQFGVSVSLSGDNLAVGANGEDSSQTVITNGTSASADNGSNASGAVYLFRRGAGGWAQDAYIKASNVGANDYFGYSMSLYDDTLAVGAYGEDSSQNTVTNGSGSSGDNATSDSGAVYVYHRSVTGWAQEAYLKASNAGNSDQFGYSLALFDDSLAVGSGDDSSQTTITNGDGSSADNSASGAGSVFVYRRSGSTWLQEAYLKAANAEADDGFAISVSISSNTLVVGAPWEDSGQTNILNGVGVGSDNAASDSGAVYVYRRGGNIWHQEAYLKAANSGVDDGFGVSVSLSDDTLAVGAPFEGSNQTIITNGSEASSDNSASSSGAVYVFRRVSSIIQARAEVTASGRVNMSWLGLHPSSGLTNYKVVYGAEAPAADCSTGTEAYSGDQTSASFDYGLSSGTTVFVRICGVGKSYLPGTLVPVYVKTLPPMVTSITLASDKSVAAPNEVADFTVNFSEPIRGLNINNFSLVDPESNSGTGTVESVRQGGNLNQYVVSVRVNSAPGKLRLDLSSVIGVKDYWGNTLQIGRLGDESITLIRAWHQEAYIKASNSGAFDGFGRKVSLSGDTLAVGAPGEDSTGNVIVNGNSLALTSDSCYSMNFCDSGAVYIYRRSASIWQQEAFVKAQNADSYDEFGASISLSGDTLIVGASLEDSNQTTITNGVGASDDDSSDNSGAVYVYRRFGGIWGHEAYVKASNGKINNYFGYSVSLSGDTFAVGAKYEGSNQTTITNGSGGGANNYDWTSSGAVYVYHRDGSSWAQQAYIKAANAEPTDEFGTCIWLSGDTLAVCDPKEDSGQTTITNGSSASSDNSNVDSGAVYIYRRTGANWANEAYIKAANSDSSDFFGAAVSLSGDTLAVGAPGEDSNINEIVSGADISPDNSAENAGAVYVFRRLGSVWSKEAYIKASNSGSNDHFGSSLALSGNSLVVGATGEDSTQNTVTNGSGSSEDNATSNSGAVYVFRRTGITWVQDAFIKAGNSGANIGFGASLSISGDSIAIGAPSEYSKQNTVTNGTGTGELNSGQAIGAVYLYRNIDRIFDPDVRIFDQTSDTITLTWHANLGAANRVKIAQAVPGTSVAGSCDASATLDLGEGVISYSYSGLSPNTKYGFRVCAVNTDYISPGTLIWHSTLP